MDTKLLKEILTKITQKLKSDVEKITNSLRIEINQYLSLMEKENANTQALIKELSVLTDQELRQLKNQFEALDTNKLAQEIELAKIQLNASTAEGLQRVKLLNEQFKASEDVLNRVIEKKVNLKGKSIKKLKEEIDEKLRVIDQELDNRAYLKHKHRVEDIIGLGGTGGGGTPGGSNTQVQFNENGQFAGSSEFTFTNDNNRKLTVGQLEIQTPLVTNEPIIAPKHPAFSSDSGTVLTITGGLAGSSGLAGGNVFIRGGGGSGGNTNGGNIQLRAGIPTGSGSPGAIQIQRAGGSFPIITLDPNSVTANRTLTIPDASGTIALESTGTSGTFTTNDGKTVTVTNGIITSIV